jgi:hypothetical protein
MKTGLSSMPYDLRVWNGRKETAKRPVHREESVYLTATLPMAQYYATKAANKDRLWKNQSRLYKSMDRNMFNHFSGKVEPVILAIRLRPRQYQNLMADDDFLLRNPDANPNDWMTSLSQFGQIAFKGTIPPQQIKVFATGQPKQRYR